MTTHDLLDGLTGFVGVVERNGADIMVKDVGFDNAMEELSSDEAELAINGCRRTSSVSPARGGVMRKRGIGVLQESNGH